MSLTSSFRDPDYCTRYYRCAHGVDQGFECPRGTAWDEETKSCSWIEQVNCDQKKLDYSTTTATTEGMTFFFDNFTCANEYSSLKFLSYLDTTTTRTKSETESAIPESSVPSVIPPTHGKDGGSAVGIDCQPTGIYTVADPEECNAYYQCDKGLRTRLNCPERQLFDATKRQCLEYERVFCGSRSANLADKNQCKFSEDKEKQTTSF